MKSRIALIFLFVIFNFSYSESFFEIFSDVIESVDTVTNKENFSELLGRGEEELVSRNFEKALYYFQKADRLMPGDKEVNLGLASCYRGIGEYKKSAFMLKAMYEKYNDEGIYYEFLLSEEKIYESEKIDWKREKLKKEFIEKFELYLNRINYENSKSVYHLGNIYVKGVEFEKALNVFEKDKSENMKNLFGAATTSRILGQYRKSIKYYNKLIEKRRGFYEAYLGRGMSYKMSGNFESAIEDFKFYLKYKKEETLYTAIARMYLDRGLTNSARKSLEEGTKYFPNSRDIRELLIETYSKLGR